ncbi:MAG: iron ABC transporter permease [Phascolarctobacterium sp.]|uniref:FecCD family ABC transporter permease n=1 Tax=Phascolarctobacterium sp. TaxID=2049039 RepID=UPI0026DB56BC|nr:iron ABC transporter permease [Phascolarctobacterium sp.]MDO4920470.1 iron ABC transporter permease [Phascolarctobacterium sp.]
MKRDINVLKVSAVCMALLAVLAALSLLALSIGSADYSVPQIINALLYEERGPIHVVVYNLRLPRLIMAIEVGACLAVAGALLQAVMRNPLADPGIIGVSAGAATAATTVLLLFPSMLAAVPLFAFGGAALACVLIYVMAWHDGVDPVRIILSGVAINTVLGAYNAFLQMLNSDNLANVLAFMNGSLSGCNWQQIYVITAYSSVGIILGLCCIKSANILQLGDEMATSLGVNVSWVRVFLSAVGAFLAASTVAVAGMIGFIGLVVPHIARMLVGSDYKALLPVSTLLGAVLLLAADTLGRTLISGMEIPVGIVMAATGGPFFLYMLRKKGRVSGS